MSATDHWAGGADDEGFVGWWSGPVGRISEAWLDVPSGALWLDIGSERH